MKTASRLIHSFLLHMFLSSGWKLLQMSPVSLEVLHSVLMSLFVCFCRKLGRLQKLQKQSWTGRWWTTDRSESAFLSTALRSPCATCSPQSPTSCWSRWTGPATSHPFTRTVHLVSPDFCCVASSFTRPFPSLDQLNGLLWWRMIKVVPPGRESWSSQTKVLPEKPWSVAPRELCCWPRKEEC